MDAKVSPFPNRRNLGRRVEVGASEEINAWCPLGTAGCRDFERRLTDQTPTRRLWTGNPSREGKGRLTPASLVGVEDCGGSPSGSFYPSVHDIPCPCLLPAPNREGPTLPS